MRGSAPFEPPTPEIARLYLDEAAVIERRREERVDRRAVAWQSITTAALSAAVITAFLLVMRAGGSLPQPLLFLVIVSSQISAGIGERNGAQWRTPRSNTSYIVVMVLLGIAAVGAFLAVMMTPGLPFWTALVPGAVMLLGFGAIGAVQLWQARGTAPSVRVARGPMPLATRIATAALGLLMAFATLTVGVEGDLVTSIVSLGVMMVVVAWLFAWTTDAGPAAFGRYWRWPQFLAFVVSAAAIIGLSLRSAYSDPLPTSTNLILAAVVLLVLVGSALLPGPGTAPASGGRAR